MGSTHDGGTDPPAGSDERRRDITGTDPKGHSLKTK